MGSWPSEGKAQDICVSFLREARSSGSAPPEKKSIVQISFIASVQRKERDSNVIEAVVQLSLQPNFPREMPSHGVWRSRNGQKRWHQQKGMGHSR